MSHPSRELGRRFGGAASSYDRAAAIQRLSAERLAARIAATGLPPRARVLEVGCGTGSLAAALRRHFPDADLTLTDLSPAMLAQCRLRLPPGPSCRYLAMDAEQPSVRPGFDLVCGNLAMQWFTARRPALAALAELLQPGGLLALSTLCDGSFASWRAALADAGAADRLQPFPTPAELAANWPDGGAGHWQVETLLERHARGIDFLRGLRDIGADLPRPGTRPVQVATLRRALRGFEGKHAGCAEYEIGYGLFRRPGVRGAFVTGTDTGVGKTLVSAILARAWQAHYWKPLQTGLAVEPGDSETVRHLAGLDPSRVVAPAYAFAAPLSPQAAARLEGREIDAAAIRLPDRSPLVVEGAGGLLVPVANGTMLLDLIARFALPAVLVTRGTLGTINHTLLSLEALRARGIPVLGVVVCGECTDSNLEAISRLGQVKILFRVPRMGTVDPASVRRMAETLVEGQGAALDPLGPEAPDPRSKGL